MIKVSKDGAVIQWVVAMNVCNLECENNRKMDAAKSILSQLQIWCIGIIER